MVSLRHFNGGTWFSTAIFLVIINKILAWFDWITPFFGGLSLHRGNNGI